MTGSGNSFGFSSLSSILEYFNNGSGSLGDSAHVSQRDSRRRQLSNVSEDSNESEGRSSVASDELTKGKQVGLADPLVVLTLVAAGVAGLIPFFVDLVESHGKDYDSEYAAATGLNMGSDLLVILTLCYNYYQTIVRPNTGGCLSVPVLILHGAYAMVEGQEFFIGYGRPYEGDDFKTGSKQCAAVREQLKSTFPNRSWQGPAADAYADQVAALQNSMQALADLDLELAHLMRHQAVWVTRMRLGFGILKFLLVVGIGAATQGAEMGTTALGVEYYGLLIGRATKILLLAIALAGGMLLGLESVSLAKLYKIDDVIDQYQDLKGNSADMGAPTHVAAMQETTVNGFDALLVNLSGAAAGGDTLGTAASVGLVGGGATAKPHGPSGGLFAGVGPTFGAVEFRAFEAPSASAFAIPTSTARTFSISGHVIDRSAAEVIKPADIRPAMSHTISLGDGKAVQVGLGVQNGQRVPIEGAAVDAEKREILDLQEVFEKSADLYQEPL